jgi:thiosulfate/3-mercaptopyruvate sulfurtransferase
MKYLKYKNKMKKFRIIFSIALSFLFISAIFSQDLISVSELAKKMSDPNLIIVSAQKPDSYATTHIKGAINLPPAELTVNEPVDYVLDTPTNIANKLGAAGISETMEIVVYDEGSSKYSGRLYWTLAYMGAKDVKILDGELTAWKEGRKPITGTSTKAPPAIFTANVQPQYLALIDEVKKANNNPNYVIIDARTPEEYGGTDETSLRKGHIPGAININYTEMLDSNGKIRNKEELKSLFLANGVSSDKTIIIYCASSVRAAIEFFVLESILEYPNVKVYDGAFNEWQSDENNQVIL